MVKEEASTNQDNFLVDINVKLRDIEEKQTTIKDRILLIGENLISEKEETNKEITELKMKILQLEQAVGSIKSSLDRIIEDRNNFVRKTEFDILRRQFKMFEPLELARIIDVQAMIEKSKKEK